MKENLKILIKRFLSIHYKNLNYSPKLMMYYLGCNVYFEYQPKDEIIFLNWRLMMLPLLNTINIDETDPEILTDVYTVMEDWFEEEFNIVGAIT